MYVCSLPLQNTFTLTLLKLLPKHLTKVVCMYVYMYVVCRTKTIVIMNLSLESRLESESTYTDTKQQWSNFSETKIIVIMNLSLESRLESESTYIDTKQQWSNFLDGGCLASFAFDFFAFNCMCVVCMYVCV